MPRFLRISDEVRDALAAGRPVVALETAAVTHGLPRQPLEAMPPSIADPALPDAVRACFGPTVPAHRALGHALAAAARAEGAVPAVVGLLRGELVVGLTPAELDELADLQEVHKISARDAALVASRGGSGGTTVAGTLLACSLAGIPVFATGGIGGVHRGYAERPDISADLLAIRDASTLVVTAGAKSILDLPATVEMLDTLGVPLVGLGTAFFPRFLSAGSPDLRVNAEARDEADAARLFDAHRSLQRRGACCSAFLLRPSTRSPPTRWNARSPRGSARPIAREQPDPKSRPSSCPPSRRPPGARRSPRTSQC